METCGVYVHIPFCKKKCAYCDFTSLTSGIDFESYFDMLIKEIDSKQDILSQKPIDSVFFGGGTPSYPDSRYIGKIMERLGQFNLIKNAEITIEANPGTVDKNKVRDYFNMGINRMSIGLQSADDRELTRIGRIHTAGEFESTAEIVKSVGFSNFNVDIMFGLPGQTTESFEKTLDFVIKTNPTHISAYSLIIEEGTPIAKTDKKFFPSEDEERLMYQTAVDFLNENGYTRYEISNFAKKGMECRHNLKYWTVSDYIGLGLGAHSFYNSQRFYNTPEPAAYLRGEFESGRESETPGEILTDYAITGLRLTGGVDYEYAKRKTSLDFYKEFKETIDNYSAKGLILKTDRGIRLSDRGIEISNYILSDFIG